MKVLEFAFDSREPSDYLPHTYTPNCVCYVGTHDNAPVMAWKDEADPDDVALAVRYLGLNQEEGFHWGMIRGGQSSVADLFIAQMQDYLGLGADSRMNLSLIHIYRPFVEIFIAVPPSFLYFDIGSVGFQVVSMPIPI